jgi:hypothetical protein
MSIWMKLEIAGLVFVAGVALGIRWHAGQDAIAAQQARDLRETDARQQRQFDDLVAGRHAAQLATLNTKLGDARVRIAILSGRPCLDPGTVSVLNATGVLERGAAAGEPSRPPGSTAGPEGDRWASDADAAEQIAICRTRFGEVAGQLNKILDIEDRRHPPLPVPP